MSVNRYQYEKEINEELILKVYEQLVRELRNTFQVIQAHTPPQMDEYINSFIDTEKNKGTLPECFGTFKAYLGDVPGNIILNYKRPKFHDEVEAERKLEERFEKLTKEQEEHFKNRCKTCYREFTSYENL